MSETRTVEISGSDIEEAIEAGLAELQVSRENVIVEILEEPARGMLGFGSKMATVRLTTAARPRSEAPPPTASATEQGVVAVPKVRPVSGDEVIDDLRVGKETLAKILEFMEIEADVATEISENSMDEDATYILQIQGDDLRSLIGKRGETLAALQYLTRLVATRELQRRANFVVDAGDYKAKHTLKLYKLASRMANQAIERGRTVHLEPMPPHERRIIHMALRHRGDVTTSSVGEGKYRKVTIVPRRN